MDCEAASERLPWLLNRTLESQEEEQVRRHLASCPRCRAEMDDTRRAAAVFGAHLPSAAIIDRAWDRANESLEPALVDRHLEACADCREELALARESRQLEAAAAEPSPARRRAAWPVFALPATLAAGLVLGLWWDGGRGGPVPSQPPPGPDRTAALESEVSRLRATVTSLEAAARQARLPKVNVPLFEILAASVMRGGAADGNDVAVPAGATEIALLLGTDAPAGTPATLAIRRRDAGEVWRGEGLVAVPPGGYVVVVPVELVPDGEYALTLKPQGAAASEFAVRVRRAR